MGNAMAYAKRCFLDTFLRLEKDCLREPMKSKEIRKPKVFLKIICWYDPRSALRILINIPKEAKMIAATKRAKNPFNFIMLL